MRIIRNYKVPADFGEFSIELPRGATILHWTLAPEGLLLICLVGSRSEGVFVPDEPTEMRRFVIAAVGQQVADGLTHQTTLEHRQEIQIPMGTIIPAGVRPEHAKAIQITFINIFEKIQLEKASP